MELIVYIWVGAYAAHLRQLVPKRNKNTEGPSWGSLLRHNCCRGEDEGEKERLETS
jgi:hypothetical protein